MTKRTSDKQTDIKVTLGDRFHMGKRSIKLRKGGPVKARGGPDRNSRLLRSSPLCLPELAASRERTALSEFPPVLNNENRRPRHKRRFEVTDQNLTS